MDHNNRKNSSDNDAAGEIISWVVIFILMFAFWPVGLPMLIIKLRSYAKPSKEKTRHASSKAAEATRQAAAQASAAAREVGAAVRQAAAQAASGSSLGAEGAVHHVAREFETAVRQAATQYSGYAKQTISEVYSDITNDFSSPPKSAKRKKKELKRLEKKSGKFISTILLLIAIALFIVGANTIARASQDIWGSGMNSWRDLWMGVFYFIGAFISFFSRNIGVHRYSRYKKYYAVAADRGIIPLRDMARSTGRSVRAVTRDVQSMINDGYFGADAYIDVDLDSLVLSEEAAEEARRMKDAAQAPPQPAEAPAAESPENQYMSIILELRALNDTIVDVAISDKIDRIEALTAKIFRIVEDDPSKLPQIRRFMNYYLPTTLKLLRSYALLEKQGVKGENITAAKENISRILDTLAKGYEQQLDQLFRSDVIDIAADINVLENLMQQDGLTDEKPELKTMEGTS